MIILIIVMLIMIRQPGSKVKLVAIRTLCCNNMRGIGNAMAVYTNDYMGHYPQLPGEGPWSKELGFSYDLAKPDFTGAQANTPRTITATWYLLVRYVDVGPKSYLCPGSDEVEFKIDIQKDADLTELWDFGTDPYSHISYAMHNPYSKYPANINKPSEFAVAADMNPWIKGGDFIEPNKKKNLAPQIINFQDEETYAKGNSINHTVCEKRLFSRKRKKYSTVGMGQNVLFADGHARFETSPNCGVKRDNIYTYWSNEENPTEQDIQNGTAPTDRSPENDAKSEEDSFLVL
jgi:prepilin-type processing-associated H-X9-DG protein